MGEQILACTCNIMVLKKGEKKCTMLCLDCAFSESDLLASLCEAVNKFRLCPDVEKVEILINIQTLDLSRGETYEFATDLLSYIRKPDLVNFVNGEEVTEQGDRFSVLFDYVPLKIGNWVNISKMEIFRDRDEVE